MIRLWETNAMRVFDALPDQKSQENALLLLKCETTSYVDNYSVESRELLKSVVKTVITGVK